MKLNHFRRLLFALCSVLLLISCSSSGGGIGGTGIISSGTVSAYGSIIVNGLEFDTSDAVIIVNGEKVGRGDQKARDYLDIGKVVLVEGTGDMDDIIAVADRVTYYDNVAGPVESIDDIDATSKEIVVLGQSVVLNVLTKFKGPPGFAFDTIAQNDLVEVSGLVDDEGAIRATFLEKTGVFDPDKINIVGVTGFVVNLGPETFQINGLTVDYSGIDPEDLPTDFTEGSWVEVEGTLDVAGGEMTAVLIEPGDEIGDGDSDQIEVLGFVTNVISASKFIVGNQVVQLDANTLFVDGDLTDISLGAKLEAEGYLENGILYADEVEFWGPDQIEVEGLVTAVDLNIDPVEFTIRTQQDRDYQVQTDNETEFEDVNPMEIEIGMQIEVKGVPIDIDHSVIVADKVSLEED
jgi:hypothetical protein